VMQIRRKLDTIPPLPPDGGCAAHANDAISHQFSPVTSIGHSPHDGMVA
jgi:hypothetical protein